MDARTAASERFVGERVPANGRKSGSSSLASVRRPPAGPTAREAPSGRGHYFEWHFLIVLSRSPGGPGANGPRLSFTLFGLALAAAAILGSSCPLAAESILSGCQFAFARPPPDSMARLTTRLGRWRAK